MKRIMGKLEMMPSRRWGISRLDGMSVEITSGETFIVEVNGQMRTTRMEFEPGRGFYSIDNYELRSGLLAASTV